MKMLNDKNKLRVGTYLFRRNILVLDFCDDFIEHESRFTNFVEIKKTIYKNESKNESLRVKRS